MVSPLGKERWLKKKSPPPPIVEGTGAPYEDQIRDNFSQITTKWFQTMLPAREVDQ
jgi:hypothetical protein